MKQNIKYGLFAVMGFLIVSCNPVKKKNKVNKIPVNVYVVRKEKTTYYNEYPGTVTALNTVELRADVSGYITGIFFNDGQYVHKGQKLYEIDRQQYQAAYEQALADLQVSKANLEKARQDAQRYIQLNKQNAIAKQILDHALSDLQSAKSQVAASKANVNKVRTDLEYSRIYAPFNGTIGVSKVKMGSLVTPNQTLLNTISSDNPMAVDFYIDEKKISRYNKLLKEAKTDDADSTFTIVLPDGTVYPYPGKISLMGRAVDPQTGTILVRLLFPNKKFNLKDGMTCEVRVANTTPAGVILVPQDALTELMGETFVYVVKGDKVSQQKIITGHTIKNKVIVEHGLRPGEKIVTAGLQNLKQGAIVQYKLKPGIAGNQLGKN